MVNDQKVSSIDESFTGEQLREGLKIRKGKKVFHKAILTKISASSVHVKIEDLL